MYSPITAEHSFSRLSPHFAHGTYSLRQAFQLAEKKKFETQSTNKVFTKSINASGIDDSGVNMLAEKLDRAGTVMPHDKDMRMHGVQRGCGVEEGLALFHR